MTTRPSSRSSRTAFAAVSADTPYWPASDRYDGSLSSGRSSPLSIFSRRMAASCLEGGTGLPCCTVTPRVIPAYPGGDNQCHGVVRCLTGMVGWAIVATAVEYGVNIGRFIREHPAWIVCAGFEGFGYRARRREGGRWVSALTLDELHALIAGAQSLRGR